MSASDAYELVALDLLLGPTTRGATGTITVPATVYVALYTTLPADDGSGGVEPSGNAYARVSAANDATHWPAATLISGLGTKSNGVAVTFPIATGNWGTAIGFGIHDSPTAGTLMFSGPLDVNVPITTNNQASFAPGTLKVTCD